MSDEAIQPPTAEPIKPWSWFIMVFALVFCWLAAWSNAHLAPYQPGDAYVIGSAIGYTFWPLLIAYAVRGRKKVRNWNSFARWFFWGSLITISLHGSVQRSEREAARKGEAEWARQFAGELSALQKKHATDSRCDFEPPLYSARTFLNRDAMDIGVRKMETCMTAYDEAEVDLAHLLSKGDASVDSYVQSADYRADIKRRFRAGYLSNDSQNRIWVLSRTRWKEETFALYNFALRHADQIQVRNEQIVIADDSVLDNFNEKLRIAHAALEELARLEKENLTRGNAKMEEVKRMIQ